MRTRRSSTTCRKGLETLLGDRGVRFSGGERQRIGLARVLLEDASVLILDEPTSALDSESEAYIQRGARASCTAQKTIIVIAHRLATVIQADQLLVIDERPHRRARHARRADGEGRRVPEAVREPAALAQD